MDYIKEVNINEAIIHILDNNSQEPILNEYKINLSDEVYNFILKHIERCLKDEELKYAIFKEERNIVKELSQEYLSGQNDIIDVSKEIARQLFVLMESQGNIPSCDLVVTSISTEYGNMLGILKMDYVKNYSHNINSLEDKIGIEIVQEITGLPTVLKNTKVCLYKIRRRGKRI